MAEWHIRAYSLDGNGGMTLLDGDVVATAQPTRELSGPGAISLTVAPEQDIELTPWKTVLVVELDGSIRGAGVISDMVDDGNGSLSVTCTGPLGYLDPLPADVEWVFQDEDPASVIRRAVSWAQSRGGTDVGLRLGEYEDTGVRIGLPEPEVMRPLPRGATDQEREERARAIDEAKYRVQWWENPTIGGVVDDMAKHVEYRTKVKWADSEKTRPIFTLDLAKRLGARKDRLRFVVGENVIQSPPVDWAGESYATQVTFLGAGEGRKMVRATVTGRRNGLARHVFISDQSVRSKPLALRRARRALAWRQAMPQITELVVRDMDNAPFGSFDVGDEVRLIDQTGRWAGTIDMWVRILSITETTESATATLTVTRADIGE